MAITKSQIDDILEKYESNFVNPRNFFAYDHTSLELEEGSLITLEGELVLNSSLADDAKRSTILRLDENAQLIVTNGKFNVFYGGDIVVTKNAVLTLGNSFINNNCKNKSI